MTVEGNAGGGDDDDDDDDRCNDDNDSASPHLPSLNPAQVATPPLYGPYNAVAQPRPTATHLQHSSAGHAPTQRGQVALHR